VRTKRKSSANRLNASLKHDSLCDRPLIVGVGGFTSEVGKTTLLCDLLRMIPGWEAIKTTRGHYRSCGKDPHTCCVSHLLEDRAVIRSGREATYTPNKDTGRYWEAGAENVHWVIATDEQLADGIGDAISRVKTPGVFVEGNSFSEFIKPDFFIMVARADHPKIKATARKALGRVSAFYVSDETRLGGAGELEELSRKLRLSDMPEFAPVFSSSEKAKLAACIKEIDSEIFV
jgi:molybdopterin-guanine dinucleotide biosynthesis protein